MITRFEHVATFSIVSQMKEQFDSGCEVSRGSSQGVV